MLQLKTNINVKIVCVNLIPYIHSHKGLFSYMSMATITTFPGTSLIPETGNWVEQARKFLLRRYA